MADTLAMIEHIYQSPKSIAGIELNLACPNILTKPVVSNDFEQMDTILETITTLPQFKTVPFGIKLGPYIDLALCEQAARVICKFPISFVVTSNSIGNALFVDAENECLSISANEGLGGLSGGFIKNTALANVRILRMLFDSHNRSDIDIVGVGGVCSGRDAFELILCGATAVQVGTCHWTEGPDCYKRIALELEEIMTHKGYSRVSEFVGKLKPYFKPVTEVTATVAEKNRNYLAVKHSDIGEDIQSADGIFTKATDVNDTTNALSIEAVAMNVLFVLLGIAISFIIVKVKSLVDE